MKGNVSNEGIKADLEWMKRVGIGGFQKPVATAESAKLVAIRSASSRRLVEPVGETFTATTEVRRHGRISITGTVRGDGESLVRFASRSSTSVHRSWRRCGDATPSGISTEACC